MAIRDQNEGLYLRKPVHPVDFQYETPREKEQSPDSSEGPGPDHIIRVGIRQQKAVILTQEAKKRS